MLTRDFREGIDQRFVRRSKISDFLQGVECVARAAEKLRFEGVARGGDLRINLLTRIDLVCCCGSVVDLNLTSDPVLKPGKNVGKLLTIDADVPRLNQEDVQAIFRLDFSNKFNCHFSLLLTCLTP